MANEEEKEKLLTKYLKNNKHACITDDGMIFVFATDEEKEKYKNKIRGTYKSK